MEKKKLLLVAISVGVFLVLTIGAALLVFSPNNVSDPYALARYPSRVIDSGMTAPLSSATESAISGSDPRITGQSSERANAGEGSHPAFLDPVELLRNSGDVPGLRSSPESTAVKSNGSTANGTGRSTETVISVPKPSTAAVPDAPPAGRAEPNARPAPASTTASSTASKPASTTTPAPASTTASTSAQTSTPARSAPAASTQSQARPAAAQARVQDDYWVQTGAFSTVARAEGVKETLASRGITSIIDNREVNGKTLFRVRIGPYTSQNEANYWLSLVKSIGGFEDSQVRQTRR